MKRSNIIRVGDEFNSLLNDVQKSVPKKMKNTQLTDDLAITMRQTGIDKQLKRLMKRRYM